MRRTEGGRDDIFVIVLSIAFVMGMAIALLLIVLWRNSSAAFLESTGYHLAVAACPPFLLVGVFSALADSTLALVLTIGTIVFANGSLYAGLASFVYWVFTILRRRNMV